VVDSSSRIRPRFLARNLLLRTTPTTTSHHELLTHEEYYSKQEKDEEETASEVVAIADTSYPSISLVKSPNENLSNNNVKCLMAKASEVSSSTTSISKTKNAKMNDFSCHKARKIVVLDVLMTNLQGKNKKHLGALMNQFGDAQDLLQEK
jgi:hypothetical protein